MAEYWMRSSSGTNASVASINELLPEAEDDCTTVASGVSRCRDTAAI
jgi:hypothetical protein